MNQRFMKYLSSMGFNQTTLDERTRAFLLSVVTGSDSSWCTNDLWARLGTQMGYPGGEDMAQMKWANAITGRGDGTWNDSMNNLPDISPNILLNPDFIGGALNWVLGTGWSVVGATAVKAVGVSSALSQVIPLVDIGQTFRLSFDVIVAAGSVTASVGGTAGTPVTSSGSYSQDVVASTTAGLVLNANSLAIMTFSNIQVKRLAL